MAFLRVVVVFGLWFFGLGFAFAALVLALDGEVGQTLIFGAVAYACWKGIEALTVPRPSAPARHQR